MKKSVSKKKPDAVICVTDDGDESDSSSTVSTNTDGINQNTKSGKNKAGNSKAGRLKSTIWSQFTAHSSTDSTGKILITQICNLCNTHASNRADRLQKHFDKCSKKNKNKNDSEGTDSVSSTVQNSSQPKIPPYFFKTTNAEKEELDRKMAKFWFSANIPFEITKSKYWLEMVEALRPGYKPACDKTLKGTLLDKLYTEKQNEMKDDIQGKLSCIIQDGWSNVHNHPILSHTIVADGKAYLLNVIDCGAEKKTAVYCAEMLNDAINEAEKQFGAIAVSATTDNCPTMVSTREKLKQENPAMLFYGDSPHLMNKLLQDISSKSQTLNKIVEVNKVFRMQHQAIGHLEELHGIKPQLPVDTRWSSHLACIDTFLKNRSKYVQISQKPDVLNSNVIEAVNSISVFKNAQNLHGIFIEVSREMTKLQSDSHNIADALHSWLVLLNSGTLKSYKVAIKNRMEMCTEDFFYAAYLLHPGYQGELLNANQREKAFDYLLALSPDYLVLTNAFLQKDEKRFPKSFLNSDFMKKSGPISWWASMKSRPGIPDEMIDLLLKFYNSPSSTASVERIFSTFGFIQNDKRNRLTQDKVTKLSFVFRALRSQDKVQCVSVQDSDDS